MRSQRRRRSARSALFALGLHRRRGLSGISLLAAASAASPTRGRRGASATAAAHSSAATAGASRGVGSGVGHASFGGFGAPWRRAWGRVVKREPRPCARGSPRSSPRSAFAPASTTARPIGTRACATCSGSTEIEQDIESAAEALHGLCLHLVDDVVRDKRALARLKIPEHAWDLIGESWRRRDPSLYGRFDFAYDGRNPPKLLEYNADTPTSALRGRRRAMALAGAADRRRRPARRRRPVQLRA